MSLIRRPDRLILLGLVEHVAVTSDEEVHRQLGLQLNISRTLIDLEVVREFQHAVIEVIS